MLATIISRLNQNFLFRYASSVRLAVPIMLTIIVAVAAGTIFESRHNSEYARIAVYDSWWFQIVLGLLALNVFCAMMSRYPWKAQQTGFVITHIGILILLSGSWVTKIYGVDGSLAFEEGQTESTVVMPRLMLAYQFEGSPSLNSAIFQKTLNDLEGGELEFINASVGHVVRASRFVPFAEVDRGFVAESDGRGPVGLSFGLKSAFFDVKEWLHSDENPEMQLGPAQLRLVVDENGASRPSAVSAPRAPARVKEARLEILKASSGEVLKSVPLAKLRQAPLVIEGAQISIKQAYQRASVSANKIAESDDPEAKPNPAVELLVRKGGKDIREVVYARYEGFTLNVDGVHGLKFRYVAPDSESEGRLDLPPGHPPTAGAGGGMEAARGRNEIEFHVRRGQPGLAKVVLKKAGKVVVEKAMKEGDILETPWMGMQIFLGTVLFGARNDIQVRSIRPPPGKNLPPSAILVQVAGTDRPFWMTQGEVKNISVQGRSAVLIFGNETTQLPFSLRLDRFTKKNYPGTETPFSYESLVTDMKSNRQTLISMNEPLKAEGFTLYQASFNIASGRTTSILSVNRDPGREIKYLGSLILCAGIVTFTLMRSRLKHSRKAQGD